jgi:hypothetical protein
LHGFFHALWVHLVFWLSFVPHSRLAICDCLQMIYRRFVLTPTNQKKYLNFSCFFKKNKYPVMKKVSNFLECTFCSISIVNILLVWRSAIINQWMISHKSFISILSHWWLCN